MIMKFQNELLRLRKCKGLSQEDLAAELDVSRQTVSKWEGGSAFPDMINLMTISEFFGVSVDSLIKDEECEEKLSVYEKKSFHYEYKSQKHIGKLPLVHINVGFGKYKSKGVLSIGTISSGILSIGIISFGIFSFGLLAFGLFAMGILSLAAFAMGGGACGIIAIAGTAVGIFTLGGIAIGVVSIGGISIASHVAIGGYASAPVAIGYIAKGQSIIVLDQIGGLTSVTSDMVRGLINKQFHDLWDPLVWWATMFFK